MLCLCFPILRYPYLFVCFLLLSPLLCVFLYNDLISANACRWHIECTQVGRFPQAGEKPPRTARWSISPGAAVHAAHSDPFGIGCPLAQALRTLGRRTDENESVSIMYVCADFPFLEDVCFLCSYYFFSSQVVQFDFSFVFVHFICVVFWLLSMSGSYIRAFATCMHACSLGCGRCRISYRQLYRNEDGAPLRLSCSY